MLGKIIISDFYGIFFEFCVKEISAEIDGMKTGEI